MPQRSKSQVSERKPTPQAAIYERNLDMLDGESGAEMYADELATANLSDTYLYNKIRVGEEARDFFCQTSFGAFLDRKLRSLHRDGVEALMSSAATDAKSIIEGQLACQTAIFVYALVQEAIEDAQQAKSQLNHAGKRENGFEAEE